MGGIKPEKSGVDFRLILGLLFEDCPNVVGLYQYWGVAQCLDLFYIHFHYRIRFDDFQYENRVFDGL